MQSKYIIILSIISSLLVILHELFKWSIVDQITVFLAPVLWLAVFGLFLFATIVAVIALIKKKTWKPVIIQMFTILLIFFFPFNQVMIELDFNMNQQEREKVALMAHNKDFGEDTTHHSGLIKLPEEYEHLSKGGGEIVVENAGESTSVFFFTFRGIMDNFSGILYAPDGNKPVKSGFFSDYKEVKRLDEHWFFISSH